MRITFLGTGTSQGVPIVGCRCSVCRSENPRNKRLRPSIYVETQKTKFVVDCTPDFRTQCLTHGVERVDAVVVTHTHADHILGMDDLRQFNFIKKGPMPVYASAESMGVLKAVFGYGFVGVPKMAGWVELEPIIIDGKFEIGDVKLTPLPVPHGQSTVLGFLMEDSVGGRAAYITDVKELPSPVKALIKGAPLLILDALRHRPHPAHMNLEEALAAVREVRPQRALFTHLTHELEHEETNRGLPEGVALAFDGQVVVVG